MIADKTLIDKARNKDNIDIILNTSINELIINNDKINGVITNNGDYNLDSVFINIGYEPSINILKSLDLELKLDYHYRVNQQELYQLIGMLHNK